MANIKVVDELIRLTRQAKISLFIWGSSGVGKSQLCRQAADSMGIGFLDFRCAQIEACDLRGLPDKTPEGTTRFLPPDELPRTGKGILFLDELNRANPEVLSAAFQLVLDRRIGNYVLPEGWSIVCAGNFNNGDYCVTELDPAFRDRFCHTILSSGQATFNEWVSYISSRYTGAYKAVSFCGTNLKHLENIEAESLGFKITPSRRSWEMVLQVEKTWESGDFSETARIEAITGLIGNEIAISYLRHNSVIQPQDLIIDGVKEHYEILQSLSRQEKWFLAWGLIGFVSNDLDDPRASSAVLDLLELLHNNAKSDRDLAIAFVSEMMRVTTKQIDGFSDAFRILLMRNPTLINKIAVSNQKRSGSKTMVDLLASRPELAESIATSVSIGKSGSKRKEAKNA